MKLTVDETKKIDIRYMRREGLLKPGMTGHLRWSYRGQPTGNIHYQTHKDYIAINYRYKATDTAEWEPVSEHIILEQTPCHFGGYRQWFKCLGCTRRVAVLCQRGKSFRYRHCHKLPYESQLLDDLCRLIEQKHKLGKRIFAFYEYGDGWGKRKGLHWKEYDRKLSKFMELDAQIHAGLNRRNQGIERQIGYMPD